MPEHELAPILLKGGRVVDPASGLDSTADVLLQNGRIAGLETTPGQLHIQGARVIDVDGLLVSPGLIDPHVHLREPGGEHKRDNRHRHSSRSSRRIHDRLLHAKYEPGDRFHYHL